MSAHKPTILRSYKSTKASQSSPAERLSIWQAARATSAAPTFFSPLQVTKNGTTYEYIDGGFGNNNPVELLLQEASNMWCDIHTQDMRPERDTGLLLSFGTGSADLNRVDDTKLIHRIMNQLHRPTAYVPAMQKLATSTELSHEKMLNRDIPGFFRFSTLHGIQDVKLWEYTKAEQIVTDSEAYLEHSQTKKLRRLCSARALDIDGHARTSSMGSLDRISSTDLDRLRVAVDDSERLSGK